MRRSTGMILGLALAASAGAAHAQQAPDYQQWGDSQNGGYRYSSAGPGGEVFEEEIRRHSVTPQTEGYSEAYYAPPPCCGAGGYEIPTYGYASQNYGWPGQGCCARGGGEVSYSSSSSSYTGGVGGYLADGAWPGGYWSGGYWPDGRYAGVRRWDYDSGWRDLPGRRPVVAPR
jgi:hypothetical protein